VRYVIGLLAVAAIGGGAWMLTLPTKEQCRATGRIVDPTERHCEAAGGYVQLREHALFHTREPALAAVLILGVSWAISRRRRRRARATDDASRDG
jgi:hypothetical protein